MRFAVRWLSLLFVVAGAPAQEPDAEGAYRTGPGVAAPKVLQKAEPKYTDAARGASIQGSVLLGIVIDIDGKAKDIEVISPLGYGLDQKAIEAIQTWTFKPGEKDGQPVKLRANVLVTFRLLGRHFDRKAEQMRTSFNDALKRLKSQDQKDAEKGREKMKELTEQKFPPAMYATAIWLQEGKEMPLDQPRAVELMAAAAEEHFGPALYETGRMYIQGRGVPKDMAKGQKMLDEAAELGSTDAQFLLGAAHETGKDMPTDPVKAKKYFRLCASAGEIICQYRLGDSLLKQSMAGGRERDRIQALAWLELAAERGHDGARTLVDGERSKLTPEQQNDLREIKEKIRPQPK